jgi:hypothetical protein
LGHFQGFPEQFDTLVYGKRRAYGGRGRAFYGGFFAHKVKNTGKIPNFQVVFWGITINKLAMSV